MDFTNPVCVILNITLDSFNTQKMSTNAMFSKYCLWIHAGLQLFDSRSNDKHMFYFTTFVWVVVSDAHSGANSLSSHELANSNSLTNICNNAVRMACYH